MISLLSCITIRILSNSYINVFQKVLTSKGSHSSVVNFYTYLGLTVICFIFLPFLSFNVTSDILFNFILMGILGALGNYCIIKALSVGELSSLAPINSYKPIVALIIAYFYLGEIPKITAIVGISLIIFGTYIIYGLKKLNKTAVLYRSLALIFSGTEAVFIKKIILLTNVPISLCLWVFAGFIFSSIIVLVTKNKCKIPPIKDLNLLILSVFIMQLSTNYVFAKMNVSYALALFQLSTILSVFLGVNIFHEKNLKQKIFASIIMIIGATILIFA